MNRLIDAFEGLFTAAANSGGELAKTAGFTLENVNWTGALNQPEPSRHPIVDSYLDAVCASSGENGSCAHRVATALLAVSDRLKWRVRSLSVDEGPDVAVFAPKFSATSIIGVGGFLPSDKIRAGLSLQGRDTYYPPHAHLAEESYWIIGGGGDWKVDTKPWFPVEPGDSVYHKPEARHAMQTNEQALLSVWLWTSHLNSKVVIIRA